jgi:hypothetical protein
MMELGEVIKAVGTNGGSILFTGSLDREDAFFWGIQPKFNYFLPYWN